jgi:hypothetical protein
MLPRPPVVRLKCRQREMHAPPSRQLRASVRRHALPQGHCCTSHIDQRSELKRRRTQ